jgi:hypothetical protein
VAKDLKTLLLIGFFLVQLVQELQYSKIRVEMWAKKFQNFGQNSEKISRKKGNIVTARQQRISPTPSVLSFGEFLDPTDQKNGGVNDTKDFFLGKIGHKSPCKIRENFLKLS